MKKGTRRLVAILTVFGVLALAPSALAQSTGTGYNGPASAVAGQTAQGSNDKGSNDKGGNTGPVASQSANGSTGFLPFTGLDLALLAGGGLVLLASGVALSRMVGRHSAA